MNSITPIRLDVYRTRLPMRSFEHAAASRSVAEAIVTRLQTAEGREGWGETLPRPYVTGETLETVLRDIRHYIWAAVAGESLTEAHLAERIPARCSEDRCINAACCAVELACHDALLREENAPPSLPIAARVTGVLGSRSPRKTARRLMAMRLFGLRDFKLKLGLGEDADAANLRLVHRRLGRKLRKGRCTLRVDVNGGWTPEETPARARELTGQGVSAIEQPFFGSADQLAEVADRCPVRLIADESLLTEDDARALLAGSTPVMWNLRISKNGGLAQTLRLAKLAAEHDVPFVVGAMVGESGILSAAQRRLLQRTPTVRFVEGNYGRFLLGDDLTRPSPRFGFGGRLRPLKSPGLGVQVDTDRLARYGEHVATLTV
ncbi:MAG: mandelate racemase/muconate lactonizing enzyme family protein [Phycisphaerae bacterium]